jgi:HD-like signal output (HDOD) protein
MAENTETQKITRQDDGSGRIIPAPHLFQGNDVKAARWLQTLTEKGDVELEDLIAVIERNPMLSRIFMGYANSLRYGLKNQAIPVTTVNRAILMLGTTRVRDIAQNVAMSIGNVRAAMDSVDSPGK